MFINNIMEDQPAASSNPRLRKPKKTPTTPIKEQGLRKNFMDSFIRPALLQDQISQGNLKDVYEDLIDFKTTYKFEDKTFTEVLNYTGNKNKNKKIAELIDKLLISSNEGEFFENAAKLGSSVGVKKAIEVQPNQGFKDLIKPMQEVEGKEKEKEKEKESQTPVLEASKQPKKEKQSQEDEIMKVVLTEGISRKEAMKKLGIKPSTIPTPKPKTREPPIVDIEDIAKDLPPVKKKSKLKKVELEIEDIAKEKDAQARAKEMRSQPKPKEMTDEEVDEILGTATEQEQEQQETSGQRSNENVKMEMKKPDMRTEIDDLQPLPSKSDFIPPMRLGTSGKDINELLEDIMYFMKNFKSQLKREGEIFKEVDKTNIEQLRKLHNKIVGKLAPKQKKEEQGKKVGIIVNADEYIREQMKKILQEQVFANLRPQDVVIDVGSRAAEGRDTNNKDFGDFSVKRTIDGGLASTREAVFRYMPSENDQDVGEEGKTEKQRKKPNRITMPKSRLNNERTNAIRMNVRNPFRIPQKTMKLKYLY
jgi:hypothetical protein